MKHFPRLFALFAVLLAPYVSRAQDPLGSIAAVFPFAPSKLLADPTRTRIYAAVPATNSIVVIDTTTLQAIATVPIGSDPVDMAISMDGNTLYVANNGSTLAAIGILDLNLLTTRTSFALPGSPVAIAAGLNGRVYASITSDNFEFIIYQFDGTSGTIQATFNDSYYDNGEFQISPDGKTLYEASTGTEPGSLKSFDVSTATPTALQTNTNASENNSQLVISHNGLYICLPSGGGNPGASNYSTYLFSTADITSHYGSFANGAYPGPLAFSPDDSLVYQTRYGSDFVLDVFNTQTFFKTEEVSLPTIGAEGYPDNILSIVTDNTGSYLFISESSDEGTTSTGQLAVLTTGSGTLTPSSILPVITSATTVSGTEGVAFNYQITASNTPTSFNATNLPAGLSVNTATGVISGTPTAETYTAVTISATNASGTATATVDIDIEYGSLTPVFTTTSLPSGTVGQIYSTTVAASNSPYSYSASSLPGGLSLNSESGVISGVPTASGVSYVDITATNDYGSTDITLPLTIAAAAVTPPVITSAASTTATVGVPFTYQITASGTPTGYLASGLPAGLTVSPTTGVISGTPTTVGTYAPILSARNAGGTGTLTLALTVMSAPAPVVTSSLTATATTDQSFSYQITAANSPTSFAASGLPSGLTIAPTTGLISGVPLAPGVFSVTLNASSANGTGAATLALTVAQITAPVITSPATAAATAGQLFSYQIAASNSPTSFAATGLPFGVTLDPSTGLVSGTVASAGVYAIAIDALNAGGTGAGTVELTVAPALPTVDILATVPRVSAASGDHGVITLTRTGDLSQPLFVLYTVTGSAKNGMDYVLLSGRQKIRPNKASVKIQIIPTDNPTVTATKTIKVKLVQSAVYQTDTVIAAKVKIDP